MNDNEAKISTTRKKWKNNLDVLSKVANIPLTC